MMGCNLLSRDEGAGEARVLAVSFAWAVVSLIVLLGLSIGNVIHWALWLPGAVGACGVAGANAIRLYQYSRAETGADL